MSKKRDKESFKDLDVILPQGARSRHRKAMDALQAVDDLFPGDVFEGTSADLRAAMAQLNTALVNIAELVVYRKMMGID